MSNRKKRIFAHQVPVEVAFAYDSPRPVASRYHKDGQPRQEFLYTCVAGDPIYADAKLHEAICAVQPQKGEPIVICREERQSESTGRNYNVWHVSRRNQQGASASPAPDNSGTQPQPQNRRSAGLPTGNGSRTQGCAPSTTGSRPINGQAGNGSAGTHPPAAGSAPGAESPPVQPTLTPEQEEIRRRRQAHNEVVRDQLVRSRRWANQAALDLAKDFSDYAEKIGLRNGSSGDTVRMTEPSIAAAATSLFIEYRRHVR